ncbi:MAG: acetylornithine deacetylase [Hyphomicrobium sp.]|nr:acetylornithine deacetylase [Hyphomicrobium sp.]
MPGPKSQPIDLLRQLVSFDTTSHKSNLTIVDFIEDYLLQHGVLATRITTPEGDKASVFATIGPNDAGGIALSAHTDVVPVDGQTWDSDPFTLRIDGGKLYGRGTSDMKGFIACALAAVPDLKRRHLATPVHLAFSYDEEIGCIGVRPMIAQFGALLPKPRLVIVGEPTSMRVVDAHKGPVRWQVEITGRAAHSSMAPLGVNAISYAARIIAELERLEAELKISTRNNRFDPPYASLQVTRIEGGTASNIIPLSCRFGFEVRATPGLDIDGIERRVKAFVDTECIPDMRRVAPEANITVVRANSVPPFGADRDSEIVTLALKLAGQNDTAAVSYATEAGLFQDAGSPSIVCGPGDIAQAHTANEWIAESEIAACMAFMKRLADWAEKPTAAD